MSGGDQIGPLQLKCMNFIWKSDSGVTVHAVRDHINDGNPKLAYTTVLTVMKNLVRRKVLTQAHNGHKAHVFTALVTEDEYKIRVCRSVLVSLCDGDLNRFTRYVRE